MTTISSCALRLVSIDFQSVDAAYLNDLFANVSFLTNGILKSIEEFLFDLKLLVVVTFSSNREDRYVGAMLCLHLKVNRIILYSILCRTGNQ